MNDDSVKIKELLNAYVDGELTERQTTEVKRLIAHDDKMAAYVDQIRKCRDLMSKLPAVSAPSGIEKAVIGQLERKMILNDCSGCRTEDLGRKNLNMRRIYAVAALISLFAVLTALVYQVVSPAGSDKASFLARHNSLLKYAKKDTPQTVIACDSRAVDKDIPKIAGTSSLGCSDVEYVISLEPVDLDGADKLVSGILDELLPQSSVVREIDDDLYKYRISCGPMQAENIISRLKSRADGFRYACLSVVCNGSESLPLALNKSNTTEISSLIHSTDNKDIIAEVQRYKTQTEQLSKISVPVKPRLTSPRCDAKSRNIILKIHLKRK